MSDFKPFGDDPEDIAQTVTGIVRLLRFYHSLMTTPPGTSIGLDVVVASYSDGLNDNARSHVFEFVKDGGGGSPELRAYVMPDGDGQGENYSRVWDFTNAYLAGFGYTPVSDEDQRVIIP